MTINNNPNRDIVLTSGKLYNIPIQHLSFSLPNIFNNFVVGMYLGYKILAVDNKYPDQYYCVYSFLIGKKTMTVTTIHDHNAGLSLRHDNDFLNSLIKVI